MVNPYAMPELPEVETVANALRPHLVGRRITSAEVFIDKLRNTLDVHERTEIIGAKIRVVGRRAKYILVELDNCHAIVIHLGMSGSCRIESSDAPTTRHDHVILHLDDDMSMRFNDPRRFGLFRIERIASLGTLPSFLQNLPPEPLGPDFTTAYLRNILKGRKRDIKSVLLDAGLIAGVGNIYACESLFLAGINPRVKSGRLSEKRCRLLVESTRGVLKRALQCGGSTIRSFKSVDGSEGKFTRELMAYGKEGKDCPRCPRGTIKRIVMGGRSTYYCPACQR